MPATTPEHSLNISPVTRWAGSCGRIWDAWMVDGAMQCRRSGRDRLPVGGGLAALARPADGCTRAVAAAAKQHWPALGGRAGSGGEVPRVPLPPAFALLHSAVASLRSRLH